MSRKNIFSINIKIWKLCANVHINEKMSFISWLIVYTSLILTAIQFFAAVADICVNGLTNLKRFAENIPMTIAAVMLLYEFYSVIAEKENIEELLGNMDKATSIQVSKKNTLRLRTVTHI